MNLKDKIWKYATMVVVLLVMLNPEMIQFALFVDAVGLEMLLMLLEVQVLTVMAMLFNGQIKAVFGRLKKYIEDTGDFEYASRISELNLFKGTHPEVIKERIEAKNWTFNYDISMNRRTLKDKFKAFMSNYFNIEIGYKNYIITKKYV